MSDDPYPRRVPVFRDDGYGPVQLQARPGPAAGSAPPAFPHVPTTGSTPPPPPGTLMPAVRPWTAGRVLGVLLKAVLVGVFIGVAVIWSFWILLLLLTFVFSLGGRK